MLTRLELGHLDCELTLPGLGLASFRLGKAPLGLGLAGPPRQRCHTSLFLGPLAAHLGETLLLETAPFLVGGAGLVRQSGQPRFFLGTPGADVSEALLLRLGGSTGGTRPFDLELGALVACCRSLPVELVCRALGGTASGLGELHRAFGLAPATLGELGSALGRAPLGLRVLHGPLELLLSPGLVVRAGASCLGQGLLRLYAPSVGFCGLLVSGPRRRIRRLPPFLGGLGRAFGLPPVAFGTGGQRLGRAMLLVGPGHELLGPSPLLLGGSQRLARLGEPGVGAHARLFGPRQGLFRGPRLLACLVLDPVGLALGLLCTLEGRLGLLPGDDGLLPGGLRLGLGSRGLLAHRRQLASGDIGVPARVIEGALLRPGRSFDHLHGVLGPGLVGRQAHDQIIAPGHHVVATGTGEPHGDPRRVGELGHRHLRHVPARHLQWLAESRHVGGDPRSRQVDNETVRPRELHHGERGGRLPPHRDNRAAVGLLAREAEQRPGVSMCGRREGKSERQGGGGDC